MKRTQRTVAHTVSYLYRTVTDADRMQRILRYRRRCDLLAAFRRIAEHERLGEAISDAALQQLEEVATLLHPKRIEQDARRITRRNAAAQHSAEPVLRRMRAYAMHAERTVPTAVEAAFISALRSNGNGRHAMAR